GLDPSRDERPRKGFAGKEALIELSYSSGYSQAVDLITSSMAHTDIRELLRLIPECFEGVAGIEIRRGEETFINALVRDQKLVFTGSTVDDGFVKTEVPLVLDSRNIGSMRIMSRFPLSFDSNMDDQGESEKVLGMMASLIARTIDAKLDGLTALPVRKYFDLALEEHMAAFQGEGRNFSLICLDIDHFKKINDEFGHDMGDQVLAALA